ncbi:MULTISPECIES: apolipoprotein N-acyltransferase [Kordiimonas]|uniref:apolipoprotein N-acyltransferase n=1 Tax=Kordiimonas TaxID=288021 RepID=UPI00257EB781|nr:apolipoprotein N-acyltransferase [Kordiimonas sp. UBA4487]
MSDQGRDQSMLGAQLTRLFDWLDKRSSFAVHAFAFLVGVLLSRTFAPANFFPLLFVAIPLMIALIDRSKNKAQAFAHGWWVGFGLFAVGLSWIGHSFTQQQAVPVILAPVAILALSAILSLYVGIVFVVCRMLWCRGWLRVLLFAAVWTLFEVARGMWFTGFPWHLVGAAWAEWLPMAQSTYYISVYGLSFLTVFAAGMFVLLLDTGRWQTTILPPVLAVLVLAATATAGYARLDGNQTHYHLGVSMRLVQANVKQREKWLSYLIEDHFDKHMTLSRAADPDGKAKGVRLLIWPETAVQTESFDRDGSIHRWRMSKLLDYGSFAITGAPRYQRTEDGYNYYNSLFALNSSADLYARYDKVHLVPFGEYLPYENLLKKLGLAQLTGGSAWTAGRARQTIALPGTPGFSPLVCYEAVFPGQVIDTRDRPEWILNITNDAWFGFTEGPYQHLALARLRAIEEGLPLVRAASTGVSAVIDGYGRTLSSMPVGREGILDSPLPQAIDTPPITTGARILLVTLLCALIALARVIYCWRQGRAA